MNLIIYKIFINIFKLKPYIHFHKYISGDWFGRHNDIRGDRIYAVGVLLNDKFEKLEKVVSQQKSWWWSQ